MEQSPVQRIVRGTYPNPRIHYPHHELLDMALAGSPQWEKLVGFPDPQMTAPFPSTVIERKSASRIPASRRI